MLNYIFSILLCTLSLLAHAERFTAGTDYEVLAVTPAIKQGNGPVVNEFFSYGCPWCYRLEPALMAWVASQGNAITFERVPVIFNPDWAYYAKAYYTAKALSVETRLTPAFFNAIITDKRPLTTNEAMIDFFKRQGVDEQMVESAFDHSLRIDMQVNDAAALMQQYHITGVPALVINGHYKVDLQMAKSEARLFAIVDFLLKEK